MLRLGQISKIDQLSDEKKQVAQVWVKMKNLRAQRNNCLCCSK